MPKNLEIERKFLVTSDALSPERGLNAMPAPWRGEMISQVYLSPPLFNPGDRRHAPPNPEAPPHDAEVRVRRTIVAGAEPTYSMDIKTGHGLIRPEYSLKISEEEVKELGLWKKLDTTGDMPVLRKIRFSRPDSDWTMDMLDPEAHPHLEGYLVGEIELDYASASLPTLPEGLTIVGEITGQNLWSAAQLARYEVINLRLTPYSDMPLLKKGFQNGLRLALTDEGQDPEALGEMLSESPSPAWKYAVRLATSMRKAVIKWIQPEDPKPAPRILT